MKLFVERNIIHLKEADRTWESDQSRGWCNDANPELSKERRWFKVAVEWKYELEISVRRYFDLHFKRHASEVVQDPEFACLGPS